VNLRLIRDYFGHDCTLGVLQVGDHEFQTIERPWVPHISGRGGTKGVSCVPPGTYDLVLHNTEAHPNTFALVNPMLMVYHYDEDVPVGEVGLARTCVLIHAANFASELRGCIAPGLARGSDGPRRMVTSSRKAMTEIQGLVPWLRDEHSLEIA
jgi:hypothetical protein